MTDRELLVGAKKGNQNYSDILWNRYQDMIFKHWIKYSRAYSYVPVEREDFFQDAYFSFLEALEEVDITRIDNNFKFSTVFFWHIANQKRKYHRDTHNHIKRGNYSYEDMFEFSDEVEDAPLGYYQLASTYEFDDKYSIERSSEEELQRKHDTFLKKLTVSDKKILEYQKQGLKRQEISEKTGYTYNQLTNIIWKIQEEAKELFDVPHYKKRIRTKSR